MEDSSLSKQIIFDTIKVAIVELIFICIGWLSHKISGKSNEEAFFAFLLFQIPLWIVFLLLLIVYVLMRIFYFKTKRIRKNEQMIVLSKNVYFDSNASTSFDYEFLPLRVWNNTLQKEEGVAAKASFEFNEETKTISITRQNIDGRVILRVATYFANFKKKDYIESRSEQPKRNIEVQFEAKVTGKAINLFTIIQPNNNYEWKASKLHSIELKEFQQFTFRTRIESNFNFVIRFEDKDCTSIPCEYLIRNIIIREIV